MSQLVRSLLPVLPWMVYLLNGYTGYDKVCSMMGIRTSTQRNTLVIVY